jgi:DNA-binding beta-propeller fold protein YncE
LKNPTTQKLPPEYTHCFWDYSNNAIVYATKKDKSIWRFDTFTKNQQLIGYATNTNTLLVKNNILYSNDNTAVYRQNITRNTIEKITDISCVNCEFIQMDGQYLLLQDKIKEQIHFINETNQQKIVSTSAKNINWLNSTTLLFYNNWELWIYNLNKDQPELITRFGTPLISVAWHPEGRHIFIATNNEIKVFELDNRELRNIITLATTTNQRHLAVDRKGDFLYYDDKPTDSPSALYQLILQ